MFVRTTLTLLTVLASMALGGTSPALAQEPARDAPDSAKESWRTREIRDEVEARLSLEAELGHALDRNELELFYPAAGSPERRQAPGRRGAGSLAPSDSRPAGACRLHAARQYLLDLGTHVTLDHGNGLPPRPTVAARRTPHPPRRQHPALAHSSGRSCDHGRGRAEGHPVPADLLELEVTEHILLEDDERALQTFSRVQKLGVHLAFDDFGTGYASLTYLKKFSINRLKIDKSFVHELRAGSNDAAIVICTVTLANLLGLAVIAEGVEDSTSINLLRGMGCDEGQGFYFAPPLGHTIDRAKLVASSRYFREKYLKSGGAWPLRVGISKPSPLSM